LHIVAVEGLGERVDGLLELWWTEGRTQETDVLLLGGHELEELSFVRLCELFLDEVEGLRCEDLGEVGEDC
jgi:hypothetical protein